MARTDARFPEGLDEAIDRARAFADLGADIVFDGEQAPDGSRGVARVPNDQVDIVVEAAEECPGECIMIEPFDQDIFAKRGA